MSFGGSGRTIDSGAEAAARIQAETARQNAEREELRWQQEQARIEKEKSTQSAESQAQAMERQRAVQADADAARAAAAAAGATGTGVDTSGVDKGRQLAGFQKVQDELKKQYDSSLESGQGTGYLGQSNTLLSKQGVNTRTYR